MKLSPEQIAFIQALLPKHKEALLSDTARRTLYHKLARIWHSDKDQFPKDPSSPAYAFLSETDAVPMQLINLLNDVEFIRNAATILDDCERATSHAATIPPQATRTSTTAEHKHTDSESLHHHQFFCDQATQIDFNPDSIDWSRQPDAIHKLMHFYRQLHYVMIQTRSEMIESRVPPEKVAQYRIEWTKAYSWSQPEKRPRQVIALLKQLRSTEPDQKERLSSLLTQLNELRLSYDTGSARHDSNQPFRFNRTVFKWRILTCKGNPAMTFEGTQFLQCDVMGAFLHMQQSFGQTIQADRTCFTILPDYEKPLGLCSNINIKHIRAQHSAFVFHADRPDKEVILHISKGIFDHCGFRGELTTLIEPAVDPSISLHDCTFLHSNFIPTHFTRGIIAHCQFTDSALTSSLNTSLILHSKFMSSPTNLQSCNQLTVDHCEFSDSELKGNISDSVISSTTFNHYTISASFSTSELKDCTFNHCTITGTFNTCAFDGCSFDSCDLSLLSETNNSSLRACTITNCFVSSQYQIIRLMALEANINTLNWRHPTMSAFNQAAFSKLNDMYHTISNASDTNNFRNTVVRLAKHASSLEDLARRCIVAGKDERSSIARFFRGATAIGQLGSQLKDVLDRQKTAAVTTRCALPTSP